MPISCPHTLDSCSCHFMPLHTCHIHASPNQSTFHANDTCPFHALTRWTPFHAISCHYIHATFMLIHTTVHFMPIHANDTCPFHAHIHWTQLHATSCHYIHATFMLLDPNQSTYFMLYTQTNNSHSQRACACAK